MPNLPEMTMVWSPATIMMASVAKRTIEPKAALDKAQAEVLRAVSELHKK
jgi:arabinogalactan oligomer/maltooligosaccharide transport system substrate-binding protein